MSPATERGTKTSHRQHKIREQHNSMMIKVVTVSVRLHSFNVIFLAS